MNSPYRKIKGHRDLSQQEIDLMNEIKEHGEETDRLLRKLEGMRRDEVVVANTSEAKRQQESFRAIALARTNIQTGHMWFVRAVALPESF